MMNVAVEEDVHAAAGTENFALNNVKKKCIRFWEIVFGDFFSQDDTKLRDINTRQRRMRQLE